PRVFALRVGRATDEFAVAAVLLHKAFAAGRALLVERLVGLQSNARALHQAARGLAIGITGAGEEGTEAARFDGHFLAAVFAVFRGVFRIAFGHFRRKILYEVAFGIARATEEKSVATDALKQFTLSALLTGFSSRDARLVREHFLVSAVEVDNKF